LFQEYREQKRIDDIKTDKMLSQLGSQIGGLSNLRRFPKFFPEHKDKELFGIISALDYTPQIRQETLDAGLYFSVVQDELFQMDIPENFVPKRFDTGS
jgi:hypothetical protein